MNNRDASRSPRWPDPIERKTNANKRNPGINNPVNRNPQPQIGRTP